MVQGVLDLSRLAFESVLAFLAWVTVNVACVVGVDWRWRRLVAASAGGGAPGWDTLLQGGEHISRNAYMGIL